MRKKVISILVILVILISLSPTALASTEGIKASTKYEKVSYLGQTGTIFVENDFKHTDEQDGINDPTTVNLRSPKYLMTHFIHKKGK